MGAPGKKMRDYNREQELRIDILAGLYKRGYTFKEMRTEVMNRLDRKTYSLSTLQKDVNRMLKEWRDFRIANLDYALQLELERIDEIIKEAWGAWEKSKQDYDKKWQMMHGVPDSENDGDIVTVKMQQSTENQVECGDPRYLTIIHNALMERRKLLGLYSPEKTEVVNKYKPVPLTPEQIKEFDEYWSTQG